MKKVIVEAFGGPQVLKIRQVDWPALADGEVLVRVTSIGMNHAELMGRRGEYRIATGEPPFTPGLEAGGIIEAVGNAVDATRIGQRVIITPDAPRPDTGYGGTYGSHYRCREDQALPAPDAIPDEQLGALWLAYLTAWGCLIWKQRIQAGQIVALPAASSSVALAAAQIARQQGCTTVGLTSSENKVHAIDQLDTAAYDHLIVTHETDRTMKPWHRDLKTITAGRGVDVFFDPVASGAYLNTEIRSLADDGCIWVYGLLGKPDTVDVTPLIRKRAAIRGWGLNELIRAGRDQWLPGCQAVLQGFADGTYRQHIGGRFKLDDVQQAHIEMEKGAHVGKLVLLP